MPCAARSASFPGVRVTRVRSLCAVFFNKSFVTRRPRSPEAPLITIRLMPFLSKHLGDPPRWEFSEISRFPVAVNSGSGIPVQQVGLLSGRGQETVLTRLSLLTPGEPVEGY